MIFVNTKDFARTVNGLLNKMGCKCELLFGDTPPHERDRRIAKFREGNLQVLITTSMLARGLDIPDVRVVINFDIPWKKGPGDTKVGDGETYMHRIGRTGRFGVQGVAVAIYDRDQDKKLLDEILEDYGMAAACPELQGIEHFKDIIDEIAA